MANPELQNYISQSRSSGMSNEQIRQSLVSQGWAEADVSEALGLGAATTSAGSAAAASGWLTGKTIAGILAVLVLGGAATYFLLSNSSDQSKTTTENSDNASNDSTPPPAQTANAPFKCSDLFTDADIRTITGAGMDNFKQEEIPMGGSILLCTYNPEPSASFSPLDPGFKILAFSVYYGPDAKSHHYSNKEYTGEAFKDQKDYPGYGTDAYKDGSGFGMLSTNQKYVVNMEVASLEDRLKMAALIDGHLNNY